MAYESPAACWCASMCRAALCGSVAGSREISLPLPNVPQHSPPYVVVRSRDRSIYFTVPATGAERRIGCKRGFVRYFRCHRCAPCGDVYCIAATISNNPRLCFSPDESLLYVNDSPRAEIKVYDVADDGSLSNRRMFRDGIGRGTMEEGNLDGMECDEHGNIWTSGPGGVWVLDPTGERIGAIRTPEICGSVVFGGPELRTLFLTPRHRPPS